MSKLGEITPERKAAVMDEVLGMVTNYIEDKLQAFLDNGFEQSVELITPDNGLILDWSLEDGECPTAYVKVRLDDVMREEIAEIFDKTGINDPDMDKIPENWVNDEVFLKDINNVELVGAIVANRIHPEVKSLIINRVKSGGSKAFWAFGPRYKGELNSLRDWWKRSWILRKYIECYYEVLCIYVVSDKTLAAEEFKSEPVGLYSRLNQALLETEADYYQKLEQKIVNYLSSSIAKGKAKRINTNGYTIKVPFSSAACVADDGDKLVALFSSKVASAPLNDKKKISSKMLNAIRKLPGVNAIYFGKSDCWGNGVDLREGAQDEIFDPLKSPFIYLKCSKY